MTNKCIKAIAFCFYWGFRKANLSQKIETVVTAIIVSGIHSGKHAWRLGLR